MPRRRPSKSNPTKSKGKKGRYIQKWNTRDDIPLDEVDQFHEQRDKIRLEGEEAAQDGDYDEDEVFALKGLDESSEEESEVEEDEDDDEPEETGEPEPPKKSKQKEIKKKREGKKTTRPAESSEEQSEEEDEEEEESWGTKKSVYYSSNAAQIESDDEEAREMEEQEALRIQARLRAPMREEDFGYSEALQNASSVDLKPVDDFWKPEEYIPATAVGADKVSILRHLQRTNPEALALAYEWEDIARSVIKTEKKLSEIPDNKENKALGLVHLHNQTLLTYASLLAFYLHLRASEKYATHPELLRQHPILKRLLTLKQSLITFEELDFVMSDSEDASELDSEDEFSSDESELEDEDFDRLATWSAARKLGLEAGELDDLLAQAYSSNPPPTGKKLPKVKLRVNPSKTDEKPQEPPKKKRKGLNGTAVTKPKVTFDVEEPSLPSKSAASATSEKSSGTARSFGFGEATSLDDADLEDKKVHRKALQFHTAKIESASARRKGARTALGGDDDVPYRERNKEKEKKRLARVAKLGEGGEDLDDAEPEGVHEQQSRKRGRDEVSGDGEGSEGGADNDIDGEDDGYYSLVKRQKKAKQAEKKAQYDAMKAASRAEIPDDAQEQQGQRAASRAILSNKGLTPKRSKSVRNPRVKKRQKFEKAKKKLASQKAVYKGGISDPAKYGGEMSGISKVVKSVRL
ncbi:SAS10_1 [Sanghuangporus weigelae]